MTTVVYVLMTLGATSVTSHDQIYVEKPRTEAVIKWYRFRGFCMILWV